MDNMLFATWYTDCMDVYRIVNQKSGSLTKQGREKVSTEPIPCRIYNSSKDGPSMSDTAAVLRSGEKLACDLYVDIRPGDELLVIRGGMLGYENEPERFFAGDIKEYYDPVGGILTGLEHKEVGLLAENVVE